MQSKKVTCACHQLAKDPDLARIVERWGTLPEHIRTVVLTLIDSVKQE